LDSRNKILSANEIVGRTAGRKTIWLRGRFDPLLAHHARVIEKRKAPGTALVVVVEQGEAPLMDVGARRELAASLRAVDYVAVDGPPLGVSVEMLDDAEARQGFISRVRARSGAAD
jgi:glycerol-3-phosphate cytidylyltransferase-like family protein